MLAEEQFPNVKKKKDRHGRGGREGGREEGKMGGKKEGKKENYFFSNSLHEEYKPLIICNSACLRNEQVININVCHL